MPTYGMHVENKLARPSASWLSGEASLRTRSCLGLLGASSSLGQRVGWAVLAGHIGRVGSCAGCCGTRDGQSYRHIGATGCEPVSVVAGTTTAVEDCGTRTSKGATSCGLTHRRLRLTNVPRYEILIVVQRRKNGLRRDLGCRSFLRVDASTDAMGSENVPRGRQQCRRGDEEGGRRARDREEPHRKTERTIHGAPEGGDIKRSCAYFVPPPGPRLGTPRTPPSLIPWLAMLRRCIFVAGLAASAKAFQPAGAARASGTSVARTPAWRCASPVVALELSGEHAKSGWCLAFVSPRPVLPGPPCGAPLYRLLKLASHARPVAPY